ncbi:hypothetical protein CSC31_2187 [Pseudomonas aeruginosa]|nr:hypothetical protein CSC31_2187 [Pseudomonas aeruginosa]
MSRPTFYRHINFLAAYTAVNVYDPFWSLISHFLAAYTAVN